jgi:hypothetical protein
MGGLMPRWPSFPHRRKDGGPCGTARRLAPEAHCGAAERRGDRRLRAAPLFFSFFTPPHCLGITRDKSEPWAVLGLKPHLRLDWRGQDG